MKRFFSYLEEIRKQKKLTKTQVYLAAFGILLFLAIALTLPNYFLQKQQVYKSQSASGPASALAAGNTYYVATNGNDANSCTQASPCQTIVHGISKLASGDTLLIRAGTYTETLDTQSTPIPSGSSWSAMTKIAGYPGETVWINGGGYSTINIVGAVNYVWLDNLHIDAVNASNYGINASQLDSGYVRVSNSEVKNANSNGILMAGPHQLQNLNVHDNGYSDPPGGPAACTTPPCGAYGLYLNGDGGVLENSDVYHNARMGLHLFKTSAPYPSNWVVRNNRFHDNGQQYDGAGILVCGANELVYNNLVYNNVNASEGISVGWCPTSNVQVYNNTIRSIYSSL
jgi:hypothetical protein